MKSSPVPDKLLAQMIEARVASGLSQSALAEILGIVPSAISKIENRHKAPSVKVLVAWADACDCDLGLTPRDSSEGRESQPVHLALERHNGRERELLRMVASLLPQLGSESRAALEGMILSLSQIVEAPRD